MHVAFIASCCIIPYNIKRRNLKQISIKRYKNKRYTDIYLSLNFSRDRNSHRGCSVKKCVPKKFGSVHRKIPVLEPTFNKVANLQVCSFIEKRLQNRYFPVNIVKYFRISILKNICQTRFAFVAISKAATGGAL